MLDPITSGLIIVLGKYALDKGAELGQEVGPQALTTAKEMFALALERLRRTLPALGPVFQTVPLLQYREKESPP